MVVNLSIKNVPDHIAEALRERARRNHRSVQGELMAIVEVASREPPKFTIDQLIERLRASGISTPSESVAMIREDRDSR